MEKKTKTLGRLKLNQLSKDEFELKKGEMNALVGGSGACTLCYGDSYPSANRPYA
ncbi:MAG: TIGR04149 family rSAM-modified RiPP [Tannerellaceae bacterium]|jgi:natural product precursor|nr:TIGR04149 family rSAM-modified RiPP [Tannerellaceae bacterium]